MRPRRAHIGLPVWLSALLPSSLLARIRKNLHDPEALAAQALLADSARLERTPEGEIPLEIFVHLSDQGSSAFGHVDLAIGDKVVSYANFDERGNLLGGLIGPGVIALADKAPYIDYALRQENKVVLGYQLRLDADGAGRMWAKFQRLCPVLEPFVSERALWEQTGRAGPAPSDPASNLYAATGAAFYKVKKRKYKWYFALNTNCVSFADELLACVGIDRVRLIGTMTPGEYCAYLERCLGEAGENHFMVLARRVYADVDRQSPER
ncbi:MAG: hypothetical protein ACOYJA_07285 [Christensenellales bacterium]